MSKLAEKILKAAGNPMAQIFDNSDVIKRKMDSCITTEIPMLNVALSGKWDGGLISGITLIAGPSKHYKTMLGITLMKAFQDKFPEGYVVYLDSELGAGKAYFENLNVDTSKIVHIPVTNVEEAKFQLVSILESLTKDEPVYIFFDSIGNLASKKELDDAIDQKSVADMSRAKALKSLFRIITPMINLKTKYFVGINHVYQTQGLFASDVMGGGTGLMLASDNVIFLGKSQVKEGTTIVGYDFKMKMEKSRFVREKAVFPLEVSFEKGLNPYSGLFEFAIENNYIIKPSNGWYQIPNEEKKYRLKEIQNNDEFWNKVITEEFKQDYEDFYNLESKRTGSFEQIIEGD